MRIPLNKGWEFALDKPDVFSPVTIPHDWLIGDPKRWYASGIGYYRRTLDGSFAQDGRRALLRFDGVYMDSELFVNGRSAGVWKYGFSAFMHDVTDLLHPGENEVLLRVNAKFPSCRWYSGAGITRQCWLVLKNPCHIREDGVHVTTSLKDGAWVWEATCEAETGGRPYEARHNVLEGGEYQPWSPKSPRLYTLRTELVVDGHITDTVETRFGFREVRLSPDEGFFLNGESFKLNGVCLHQEYAIFGAAAHPDMIRRQFLKMREMGVNAIRTAHNPPPALFMDLADEMGMLVISEFTDVWRQRKTDYDYARFFDAWYARDVESWIRRDRCRPSVILWSLGNEIADTHADAREGAEIIEMLKSAVRAHDPCAHASITLGSNFMAWENTQKCADALDAVGYNYAERLYAAHHAEHPAWVIYGSETCSTVQSRGMYHFPLRQSLLADDDLQCSSLGNSTTSWGAKNIEACITDDQNAPFSMGHFIWSGQDYLGEPTPYHTKNSYFGMIDTAGFEKDAFYTFQAGWTQSQSNPMVHLYPYWDFSPGQMIDVRASSNLPEVELFLNDESLGQSRNVNGPTRTWRVQYRPGVLKAVAYRENGCVAAQSVRQSFGEAEQLRLEYERFNELTFVTITAADAQGRPVQNANRRVRVKALGGELVGLDNGDATDMQPYQEDNRRMFAGKLLAVIRHAAGEKPTAEAVFDETDIPVRKIELTVDGLHVRARLLPENATHADVSWRLANASGVDSNLGTLEMDADGLGAWLNPTGNGEAYVRCGVNNGLSHIALYAQAMIPLSGYREATLDPFSLASAGLYASTNADLTNGNDRGVATPREGSSRISFTGLDFGSASSDEMSVWLFPLVHEPFTFEVWEGLPGEGALLAKPLYNLGMVWNEYREVRFRLAKPLSGTASLSFVFTLKTHFKGFMFHGAERAYRQKDAAECDRLYGDHFLKSGGAVLDIRNNTTLIFDNLDFTGAGADAVALTWRSENSANPLQVILESEAAQQREMLTLPASAEYAERVFPLGEPVRGRTKVSLVFLPGAALDLKSLRFIRAMD